MEKLGLFFLEQKGGLIEMCKIMKGLDRVDMKDISFGRVSKLGVLDLKSLVL